MPAFQHITPDTPGYPWTFPTLHKASFPTPGMFFDLSNRRGWFQHWEGFDAFVKAALGSALIMADADPELADANTSIARRLRQVMRTAIVGSDFNAELYACDNENYCGGANPNKPGGTPDVVAVDHMMDRYGLGISWMPRHANNLLRIESGNAPERTTTIHGEVLPGTRARWYPLIWIPAVDLDLLAKEKVLYLLEWPDGTSTHEPPPCVQKLGVYHPTALPGNPGFSQFKRNRTEVPVPATKKKVKSC
jgi:hypothetical protein